MDEKERQKIKKLLASLSHQQREVLRRVCQGMLYKDVAAELVTAVGTVKAHMYQVYVKLGLDEITDRTKRRNVMFEDYCPILSEEQLPPPPPDAEEPKPVPQEVLEMVEEDEKALVVWQPKPVTSVPSKSIQVVEQPKFPGKAKQAHPLRWMVFGMVLGTLLVASIAWVAFNLVAKQSPREEPTQLALATSTSVIATVEVTVIVTQPAPAPQVVVVTATSLPASPTPQPTDTPAIPTQTPLPTASPTSAVAFPFQDNFNNSYDPRWRVLSGEAIVTNGKLGTASSSTTIEIGDQSWSNYTVDFDFIPGYCPSIQAIVAQQLRYSFCDGDWQVFNNNKWDTVADGPGPRSNGHFRLVVSNSSYTIFINGVQFFDIKYGQPLSGPFAIVLGDRNAFVDNVVITSP